VRETMLGDKDLGIPAKMLDFCAMQHKLISHNIANAEQPNYHRLEATFSDELAKAIEEGDMKTVASSTFQVKAAEKAGVSPEQEVAQMTRNSLMFDTFAQIANFRLRLFRQALGK
jgi:flagellar basal body rod protein FlgB